MSHPSLPRFIEPMLARQGKPFDSHQHLFEVKWDGTRGIAFIDEAGVRIMNRRQRDISQRYPELQCLSRLPRGTVIDGEIVVLTDGRPDFQALLSRDQTRTEMKIRHGCRQQPAVYIVFDQLYRGYEPVMTLPMTERRQMLRDNVAACRHTSLVMSEGVTGQGKRYFDEVCARGLEGVIAKRLDSPYLPGRRSDCWQKIKRCETLVCAVIGYVLEEQGSDLGSLVLAADVEGVLRYVGRVGSGFSESQRAELLNRLATMHCARPIVACRVKEAIWVEPQLLCIVRFMERTRDGHLRAPVYGGLYAS